MSEPASPGSSEIRHNPYAGPRALGDKDQIFGRDREIEALRDLLIAERIVVLYSPAGAGKTSLIEAKGGLREQLREGEGFAVLPSIRVGTSPTACSDWPPTANRFLMSTLRSLEEGVATRRKLQLSYPRRLLPIT